MKLLAFIFEQPSYEIFDSFYCPYIGVVYFHYKGLLIRMISVSLMLKIPTAAVGYVESDEMLQCHMGRDLTKPVFRGL